MKYKGGVSSNYIGTVRITATMLVFLFLMAPFLPRAEPATSSPSPVRAADVLVDPVDLGVAFPDLEPGYVIICPDSFKHAVIPLAVERTRMGLPSRIYTIDSIEANYSGMDREQKVHNFLRSLHDTYPSFRWLFIVGDSEFLEPRALWDYALDRGQPFQNYYYSDVYYAGLDSSWDTDGNGRFGEYSSQGVIDGDINWDVYVGRLPASTEQQAENYVNKLLRYEKNPPVGAWMGRFLDWGSLMEPPNRDFNPHKYLDYRSNAYKVCQRVESNLPDHLDVEGLFDYPQLEGGNYTPGDGRDTLNRANMLSGFNRGAAMLNFVGQARYEAYALNDYGPPTGNGTNWVWNEPMRYSDHSLFTNGDMLPFMYASTCDTAKFFNESTYNDMSLETWLTSPSGGIVGLISSTGTSARGEESARSWGNWYLDEEFWKLFLNGNASRPGNALFTLKDQYREKWLSPTIEMKETILGMIYAYILLGDPWVDVYTAPAGRFAPGGGLGARFFQGNHTVRFQVLDRDGIPVPRPRVTLYNSEIYRVLTGSSDGWMNATIDLGSSSGINMTISRHNMVPAFYRFPVEQEISDISLSADYSVVPDDPSSGDVVNLTVEVRNLGGMVAEDVGLHVMYNGGNGDPAGPYIDLDIGDVDPWAVLPVSFNWTARAGNHSFSLFIDSRSEEIDPLNNRLEIPFNISWPKFEFRQGSGTIRPSSLISSGSMVSVDYDILNTGEVSGSIELRLFMWDPSVNGTPISNLIEVGEVEAGGWGNGTIPFPAPDEEGLLYLIMDPMDRYPSDLIDDPVKSLIRIDHQPIWTRVPSLAVLEDSRENELRLDTIVRDIDDPVSTLEYSVVSCENLTCRIVRGDEESVFLYFAPLPDWNGRTFIILEVRDRSSADRVRVNVSVASVNDPPHFMDTVGGVMELSTLEDASFSFVVRASDREEDNLTFSAEGAPFFIDPESGQITWTPGQEDVGVKDYEITIRDTWGASTSMLLRLTVVEVNDPPRVGKVEDVTLHVGETRVVGMNVSDEEGDDLTFGSNSSLVWMGEDDMLHVNGSSSFVGRNPVRITVSDGLNTVYVSFNITILGGGVSEDGREQSGVSLQYLLGGAGTALAVLAVIFLIFVSLKGTRYDKQVIMELDEADAMYEDDLSTLNDEYPSEEGFYGE